MIRGIQGQYKTISTVGETARAFIPTSLPPNPTINWTPDLRRKYEEAHLALGRLDGILSLLPDVELFLYMYVRKEAVLSSMIEGTQSSLSDLLLFELDQKPNASLDDVEDVSHYVAAFNHGLNRLRDGFPLSARLIREIHGVLLRSGRGSRQTPGEFRQSQNWIGGSRLGNAVFVPPPPETVVDCMSDLELFLHDKPEPTSALLKATLAHVQFETIHPFLDGNGRVGRLLITLLLCEQKLLQKPLLYLSLYFKTHRQQYYDLLNTVRLTGDWEAWLDFFADAVISTATQAVDTARQLIDLSEKDRSQINGLGIASAASVLKIHQGFLEMPIATSGKLSNKTGLTPITVNKALAKLETLGIVSRPSARKRNRIFIYSKYLNIINQGAELTIE